MIQGKTVFIIPGYRQNPTSKAYKSLAKVLRKDGYRTVSVKVPWKNSTISQNTEYFLDRFVKNKAGKKYILGFSYGAMIALIASTKVKSDGLILCSLSPYFREDLPLKRKKAVSTLERLRYKDFLKLKCSTLARETLSKQIVILYGTEESRILIRRATRAFSQIKNKKKYIIPILKTEHDLGDTKYLNSVELAARGLL